MSRRRILEVEVLETREVLSDMSGTAALIVPPPLVPSAASPVIDPTLLPATNASTLQVYVTALGTAVNGSMTSITVQSAGAFAGSNGGVPIALQVGGNTYNIDCRIYTASGMQFTVLSGINSTGLSIGTTAVVIFGPESTPPPAVSPPPLVPPVPPDPFAMAGTTPPPVIAPPPPVVAPPPPVVSPPPVIAPPPPVVAPPPPEVSPPPVIAPPPAVVAPPPPEVSPPPVIAPPPPVVAPPPPEVSPPPVIAPPPPGSVVPAGYVPPPMIMPPPPGVVPPVDPTTMPFPQ